MGGFQKMMDVIFWVATHFATENIPSGEVMERSRRNRQSGVVFVNAPDRTRANIPGSEVAVSSSQGIFGYFLSQPSF